VYHRYQPSRLVADTVPHSKSVILSAVANNAGIIAIKKDLSTGLVRALSFVWVNTTY
jgi:hypothetical protein